MKTPLHTTLPLYRDAERRANHYNALCLTVLAGLMLVCILLNVCGVFVLDGGIIAWGCGLSALLFAAPQAVALATAHRAEQDPRFKLFVLGCAFAGAFFSNLILTVHALLLLTVPLFALAQYRDVHRLMPGAAVLSALNVLAGVFGGYVYAAADPELRLLRVLCPGGAARVAASLQSLPPDQRPMTLWWFALPRMTILLALLLMAAAEAWRNNQLLERQAALLQDVGDEMTRTNRLQTQVIEGMAALIENRDFDTGEHVRRTGVYVRLITDALQAKGRLSAAEADNMVKAAPLHDIGKVVLPDRVLQKPGPLTMDEYEDVKLHAAAGAKVIREVFHNMEDEAFLQVATEIAGSHHERWDGSGYPAGLRGEEIPLAARIMAVADAFDALVSARAYKAPYPADAAFEMMASAAGTQFDPELVQVFLSLRPHITAYLAQSQTL